ncbi:hypothetical protein ACQPXT_13570 [Streptomyces sp. CA-100214]
MGIRDAARNFGRSLKPGDDRELARQLHAEQQAAAKQAAADRAAAIQAMSDRDKQRTAAEIAASKERGRRGKRSSYEPPARGSTPENRAGRLPPRGGARPVPCRSSAKGVPMTDQQPQPQPRIPGVRYRRVKREDYVPVTFNGETKLRKREWDEYVPVPPVNLDRLYLRAVIGIAVFLTVVAVVWSTSAIGRLLGGLVPGHPEIGYLGAASFEVPWVTCLMVQWILRYQPERAKAVSIAGWVGLGIVVSAIIIDGVHLGLVEVGVVGAFVSIMAKGMWWVILRLFHVPLDEDHAGWLGAKRQELAVARVMLGEQQSMGSTEAYLTATLGYQPGTGEALTVGQPVPAPELPAAAPAPVVEAAQPTAPSVPAGPRSRLPLRPSRPRCRPPRRRPRPPLPRLRPPRHRRLRLPPPRRRPRRPPQLRRPRPPPRPPHPSPRSGHRRSRPSSGPSRPVSPASPRSTDGTS